MLETKAINLFRGQTLQRGLKYAPLRKFVLFFDVIPFQFTYCLINHGFASV